MCSNSLQKMQVTDTDQYYAIAYDNIKTNIVLGQRKLWGQRVVFAWKPDLW